MHTASDVIGTRAALASAARQAPDEVALVAVARDGTQLAVTRQELCVLVDRTTEALRERGLAPGSRVAVALAWGVDHVRTTLATWAVGGCVLPLDPRASPAERDQLLELFEPDVVVGAGADLPLASSAAGDPLDDPVQAPSLVIGTGGSTGRAKLIRHPSPWGRDLSAEPLLSELGLSGVRVQLVPGPPHHSFGFEWTYRGLLAGRLAIVTERFSPEQVLRLVGAHQVEHLAVVPTMMLRLLRSDALATADLSSLRVLFHTGGPCPPWVKRAWIDLLGPDRVLEAYGSAEAYGNTVITGREWLDRPGSVGRPLRCEVSVRDDDGNPVPAGEVGEVHLRRPGLSDRYLGATARISPDGFGSMGDIGWVDGGGYLYLADRRLDLIVSGGANVYPAEVEAVLLSHEDVEDAVVIGLPDDEWGSRVHALVVARPGSSPSVDALRAHSASGLTGYKVPRTFELVPALPRDGAGKVRRSELRAERLA